MRRWRWGSPNSSPLSRIKCNRWISSRFSSSINTINGRCRCSKNRISNNNSSSNMLINKDNSNSIKWVIRSTIMPRSTQNINSTKTQIGIKKIATPTQWVCVSVRPLIITCLLTRAARVLQWATFITISLIIAITIHPIRWRRYPQSRTAIHFQAWDNRIINNNMIETGRDTCSLEEPTALWSQWSQWLYWYSIWTTLGNTCVCLQRGITWCWRQWMNISRKWSATS